MYLPVIIKRPIIFISNLFWFINNQMKKGLDIVTFIYIIIIVYFRCKKAGRTRNNTLKPRLLWGTTPIRNNKYWSNAMRSAGYVSHTLMTHYYSQNKVDDFDYYLGEFSKQGKAGMKFLNRFSLYYDFLEVIENYDIIHIPCDGFILEGTILKKYEVTLLKMAGIKIVVIPYGSDYYRYSRIRSPLLINVLLKSYPAASRTEDEIQENVNRWVRNADIFLPSIALDGIGRWDVATPSTLVVDTEKWTPTIKQSHFNGLDGLVKVIHTPNHRGFKGTDFIVKACEDLKEEGLQVELVIIEGRSNDEVADLLQTEADILVEQLIFNGYALSGLEGMSSELPVLSNLDDSEYTQLFYLYSFLDECPILSTTPYTIKDNLRILVKNPELRKQLGRAGRKYVEKYHSNVTAQYMFGEIYKKIWFNQEINLLEMFEPLNRNSYNNGSDKIKHPLVQGKLVQREQYA
jgi:glycosyltransferase involved in cell wall biosynthesis